jgi:hypothetical protein
MVTMNDEIFDRTYQSGRAALNADIDRALANIGRTIGDSLKVLHRIEWSAPWQREQKRA